MIGLLFLYTLNEIFKKMYLVNKLNTFRSLCTQVSSVPVSEDQAGPTDQGRPIPSKCSDFFSTDKIMTGGNFIKTK